MASAEELKNNGCQKTYESPGKVIITKLTTQCSEQAFELELKSADNRVLQEQLLQKNVEINDLQEKVFRVEQQLSAKVDISSEKEADCTQHGS